MPQKITPCLWFDTQAEDAASFWCSVFKNSHVKNVARYTEAGPGEPGSAMVVEFELDGVPFTAVNGGPEFTFDEAVSFQIACADQAEVDYYWDALTADGGQESQCGWLKDKFGLSWQVVPTRLPELLGNPDTALEVSKAMFQMKKIDIAALERAAGLA
ncbi:MAG TPA: VOC family protein [Frankiaceae bacterium]|jgi:predicted 3-demethylubiquinone-9 3-methyltransferase (glyoxalase superfamily)|nr:VOC family protein [Frankiaceae bacterium]